MQRVFRYYSLLSALTLAAGLTACGDKVQVQGPTSPTVLGVTVTPPSATMQVGDKLQFAASVNAGQGVARTVTWKSSNTAVVTVDNTGLATAVTAGTASIVATSTVDPSQSGAAAVTVGGGLQPTITVSNINQTTCAGGICNSVPANLQNVQGQIDVTFNVDPGSQKLAEVDLIMNCTGPGNSGTDTVVARQTLSSSSIAAEAASAPITLSFNTATFNAATGAVAFKNGSCTVKGKAVTTSGTQTNNTVSATQALVLNNTDFIVIAPAITTTPTAPQLQTATDANGLLWNAGAVNVTAVPVIFTASRTIVSGAISLVNGSGSTQLGQNAAPVGAGGTVATISGITPAAGLLTATFPNSTSAAGGVGGATVDTLVVRVSTVDNSGNPGPTLVTTATPGNFIRLDNLAPPDAGLIVVNFVTQNATNNWVGANFMFTKAAGFIVSIPATTTTDNNGVDKVTETPQFSTAAAPTTWTNITTTAAIGESSSALAFNFRFNVCDALMNCAAAQPTSLSGSDKFGVDVTPPRITNVQGPQNLEIVGIGQSFANGNIVSGTLTDSSGTGSSITGSGFSATPLLVAETQLAPSGASGQMSTCVIGTPSAPVSGNTTCAAASLEPNGVNVVPTIPGMYTLTYQAIDQAGNVSPAVTIMFYDDKTAPAVSNANITIPGTIAQNTPFSATATDNMDVANANGRLHYPGLGLNFFEPGGANPAGVPFDNTLTRSSTVTVTLSTFFQSLVGFNGATLVGSGKPNTLGLRAVDAANNLSVEQVVALPPQNIAGTGATPYSLGTGNNNSMQAMALQASPTTVSAGGATAGDATSTTLTAVITAANQQVNTPFTSVCFFYENHTGAENGLGNAVNGGATGDIVLIGCTTTPPADVTTGTTRTFTYQMPWTPGAKFPTGGVDTWAVGINAATDGLIVLPFVVTIVP
jgi:hypothetical protein